MIGDRIASFRHALAGLRQLVRTQPNARIHLVVTGLVTIAGWVSGLTRMEWALLVFAIALVWVSETLNTALEFLADAVSPEHNPLIMHAKDIAAGAVLLAALTALAIAALVFF